jgi:hypothetical protein
MAEGWHIVVGGGMVGLENATWDDVVDEIRERFGLTAFRAVDVIDRYTSICVQSKNLKKIREGIEKQKDRHTKAELEALNYLLERTRELRENEDLVESEEEVRVVKNGE